MADEDQIDPNAPHVSAELPAPPAPDPTPPAALVVAGQTDSQLAPKLPDRVTPHMMSDERNARDPHMLAETKDMNASIKALVAHLGAHDDQDASAADRHSELMAALGKQNDLLSDLLGEFKAIRSQATPAPTKGGKQASTD